MALIESMNRDGGDEDEDVEFEEPMPMIEELPDPNRYDDDDIELV
jgi:hypothetical protein